MLSSSPPLTLARGAVNSPCASPVPCSKCTPSSLLEGFMWVDYAIRYYSLRISIYFQMRYICVHECGNNYYCDPVMLWSHYLESPLPTHTHIPPHTVWSSRARHNAGSSCSTLQHIHGRPQVLPALEASLGERIAILYIYSREHVGYSTVVFWLFII